MALLVDSFKHFFDATEYAFRWKALGCGHNWTILAREASVKYLNLKESRVKSEDQTKNLKIITGRWILK